MSRWRIRLSVPLVGMALALGLAVTAGLVSLAVKGLVQDEEASFGIEVGAVKDTLVQRLTSVDEMLHGMRLLFDASKSMDADAFQVVGNDALTTNSLAKEVMYLPRITGDERNAFERSKHGEGYPSFRISNRRNGEYVPADRHEQHFPIVFFEPFTPLTSKRLGLDLLSEADTRTFVQRAIDTGLATAAIDAGVASADEYLVLQAVYADKPKPGLDAVIERRQLVSGVVAVKVDASRLLETSRPMKSGMSVVVCARPALDPQSCVTLAQQAPSEAESTGHWIFATLTRNRDVAIGAQRFVVRFRQDLHWQHLKLRSLLFALLAGGIFTTMLVSLARSIRARSEDLQRRNADIQQVV
ncbi:MAG: CHASE domain-containing protein, partial [Burkholderiaceae bacterium]